MNIFEFELRYNSFDWLQKRFWLKRSQDTILSCTKRTNHGWLTQSLQESSLEQLREATEQTYTKYKQWFLQEQKQQTLKKKTVADYIERLEYELKVIKEMWYNTYFLIVQDYITWSKNHKIVVWPWRWSCAWSLLSYALWISDIDPLEYDLIFERFLNPGRISMPDIDTDFEDTQREKVIEYIKQKYWSDNVAHIGTYMTMAAKAAFKDVARVYGVKFEQSNKLSSLITEKTIQKSLEANSELQDAVNTDGRIKQVLEIASKLEWTVRQIWVHACGMIIAPQKTKTFTPIQYPPKSWSKWVRDQERIVSQYEWPVIETIWLLKMDVLWLRNLSIIKHTIKIIAAQRKVQNKKLEPLFQNFLDSMLFEPPLDDAFTYKKIFHKWDTSWVFQFESDGMKQWLKKLKPTEFNDLIAMVSLYRPGPMEFIPSYIDRKHEQEPVTYMHRDLLQQLKQTYWPEVAQQQQEQLEADLKHFMGVTYGIAVYQEQLMRLVQAMAWFSLSEADKLRKWVGKKIKEVIEKIKKEFIEKAAQHKNYKPETAMWVYEKMVEPAADYSFNKSHAACYAYVAYQTAWLKAHFPVEFHAALLRSVEEDTEKLAKFINEIQFQWYVVKVPSVNQSFEHVAAVWWAIILGFRSIKWIWSDIAYHLEDERNTNGPYSSLSDFVKRNSSFMNKKSVEALCKSWALDEFYDRFTLVANIHRIIDRSKMSTSQAATWWLFAMEEIQWSDLSLEPVTQWSNMDILFYEQSIFKTFLSSHPLDWLFPYIRSKYIFISMFADVEDYWEYSLLGYIKWISKWMRWWFFIKVEDISWELEFYCNEKSDLALFDIVVIKWRKWKSPRINEMLLYSRDEIVEKAQSKWLYDPQKTVAVMRKERMIQHQEKATKLTKDPAVKITEDQNTLEETKKNIIQESSKNQNALQPSVYAMPEDIEELKQLKQLLTEYPWDIHITIWTLQTSVNQTWRDLINKLLS